ncbi:MAG: hypothetical protein V8Q75_05615 [Bacilli bacterium]
MKKIISNVIYAIVMMVASYLLVANFLHILYLRQADIYDFNNSLMADVRNNICILDKNKDLVANLDAKVYSGDDLKQIKEKWLEIYETIKNNKILAYNGQHKIVPKDLFELYTYNSLSVTANISMLNVLAKYDDSVGDYLELYKKQWVANAYKEDGYLKVIDNYKYHTPDLWNNDIYTPNHNQILSIIHEYNAAISTFNYETQLLLKIGGVKYE